MYINTAQMIIIPSKYYLLFRQPPKNPPFYDWPHHRWETQPPPPDFVVNPKNRCDYDPILFQPKKYYSLALLKNR